MSNNYKSTLQSNNTELSSNNLDLQSLIDQANALPDAGGVELPELTNEGTASDLLSGKELIDGDGNKVTGTFSIETELSIQDDLIAQIQAVVDNLPEATSGGSTIELCTVQFTISYKKNSCSMYYTDENMNFMHISFYSKNDMTIEIPNNTIVAFDKGTVVPSGNYNKFLNTDDVYAIRGDCAFSIS